MRDYARTISRLDLRSLAAMRVGLGLLVLVDLGIRSVHLTEFYTEAGVLPRVDRLAIYGGRAPHSLYDLLADSPSLVALAFGAVALAALAMTLGVLTRIAVGICWVSTVALQLRMPLVTTGGDVLLSSLLLWSMFLPLDARWSLSARHREEPPTSVSNLASFALLLQMGVVFGFAGGSKLSDPTWRAGEGVYYALTAEFYTTPAATWLLETAPGWLLATLTYAVIAYELACPALLLVRRRMALARTSFVLATIAMNLCFWLCLRIGIFSWVAVVGCLALLPGEVWDRAAARLGREPPRDGTWPHPMPRPAMALLGALLVLMMIENMRLPRLLGVARPVDRISAQLGLDQRGWPMFSPTARDQGWFVLLARLADGRTVDASRGGAAPRTERPTRIADEFTTYRERKYYMNLERGSRRASASFLRHRCAQWNGAHTGDDRAVVLRLIYMRDTTLPGNRRTPVEPVQLAAVRCSP